MTNLVVLMSFYGSHHRKEVTKITHFFGVPCIIVALQILLSWPRFSFIFSSSISLAWIVAAILLIYYLFLDVYLALVTAAFLLLLTYLAQTIAHDKFNLVSFGVFCILFIMGWIAQFIGHYFEGKRPAFLDNIFQVVVAPIFLVAELCFALGFRRDLQEQVRVLAANIETR